MAKKNGNTDEAILAAFDSAVSSSTQQLDPDQPAELTSDLNGEASDDDILSAFKKEVP